MKNKVKKSYSKRNIPILRKVKQLQFGAIRPNRIYISHDNTLPVSTESTRIWTIHDIIVANKASTPRTGISPWSRPQVGLRYNECIYSFNFSGTAFTRSVGEVCDGLISSWDATMPNNTDLYQIFSLDDFLTDEEMFYFNISKDPNVLLEKLSNEIDNPSSISEI